MSLWDIEQRCWENGFGLVCGADEAGAGPLAGPVYAAAVILPRNLDLLWLNDSKKVTPKRRDILFDEIREKAIAYSVVSIDEKVIDEINIFDARMRAMAQAVTNLVPAADYALIDGNADKGMAFPHETVVKGDAKSANIAAASILAKVSRDRYMEEMALRYPEYRFDKHKGYPTKLHYELLEQYGPCPIHRQSFLKKFYAKRERGIK